MTDITDYPDTIRYPNAFKNSLPPSFDGPFNWSWTKGCFGDSGITPTDIDGIVERKGQFLVFETKAPGKEIPKGQMILFNSLYKLDVFTILFIEGKTLPEKMMLWRAKEFDSGLKQSQHWPVTNIEKARDFLKHWYDFADSRQWN